MEPKLKLLVLWNVVPLIVMSERDNPILSFMLERGNPTQFSYACTWQSDSIFYTGTCQSDTS